MSEKPPDRKVIAGIILCVIFIIVSFFIGKHLQSVAAFTISRQIDFVSVLNLGITVFFALYITRILGKRDAQRRTEKDIFIVDVKDFKELFIRDILELVEPSTVPHSKVVTSFKAHRKSIHSICDCAQRYELLLDASLKGDIENKVKTISDLFTNTAPDGDSSVPGIVINDLIITITDLRKTEIQAELIELKGLLFDLVVHVNRA